MHCYLTLDKADTSATQYSASQALFCSFSKPRAQSSHLTATEEIQGSAFFCRSRGIICKCSSFSLLLAYADSERTRQESYGPECGLS